jgi:hypothetical protein
MRSPQTINVVIDSWASFIYVPTDPNPSISVMVSHFIDSMIAISSKGVGQPLPMQSTLITAVAFIPGFMVNDSYLTIVYLLTHGMSQ